MAQSSSTVILPILWIKDAQWMVWHATDAVRPATMYFTTCGMAFETLSETLQQSFTVIAPARCATCDAVRSGRQEFVTRGRGRPRLLPAGPKVIKPRGRPRKSVGTDAHGNPLAVPSANVNSYVRGDGKVITRTSPTKADKAKAVAEEVDSDGELDLPGGFEVGRRLSSWVCIVCSATLVEGDRYCSRWCIERDQMDQQGYRFEKAGKRDLLRAQHYYATGGRPGWIPQARTGPRLNEWNERGNPFRNLERHRDVRREWYEPYER